MEVADAIVAQFVPTVMVPTLVHAAWVTLEMASIALVMPKHFCHN